jgi:small subunit ribosomal protein S20
VRQLEVEVAHSKSALKRWRQNEAHRERNKPVRSEARTAVKKARETITSGGDGEAAIKEAMSILDRAAKRNVIHKNAASRHKSRLMRLSNKSHAPSEEAPKKGRKTAAKKTATKKTTARKTATRAKKS